jgi:Zn-dependent protease/CBS domain-containing protein
MMDKGIRIGKIAGIEINIDWSWLLIFLLISWELSAYFSSFHPQWSTLYTWGISIVASILFFVSILVHELAHSLVSIRKGLPVRNITLFIFGGVSNIQHEPPSPWAEFILTIVGPASSLLIGLVLLLMVPFVSGVQNMSAQLISQSPSAVLSQISPIALLFFWLGSINLLLGVFNLIPGFPLDGGRILRSILWAATNNLRKATRWASLVGQVIAWAMIIGGIAMIFGFQLPFFGQGFISGIWLAFIGWFLNSASIQSYRQVVIQDILEGVPVQKMMRQNPPIVSENLTLDNLVHDMVMGSDDQAFPVVDANQLEGLVTLDDIRKVPRDRWDAVKVAEIMTPIDQLVIVKPEEDAAEALDKLMEKDVGQLPVMEDGTLEGILRRQDIMRWLKLNSKET